MYADAILMQPTVGMLGDFSLWSLAQAVALILLGAVLLILFRPLLKGIARAAQLAVKPHLTFDERRARRLMRDAELVKRLISASTGPDDASELRAIAARA